MQGIYPGLEFRATITAYDTTDAVIGSVSITAVRSDNEGSLALIGATSPVPIAKLVLSKLELVIDPEETRFIFGTIYVNPGMLIRPYMIPYAIQALNTASFCIDGPQTYLFPDSAYRGGGVRYHIWVRPRQRAQGWQMCKHACHSTQ